MRRRGGMCHRDTEAQRRGEDWDCRFGGWVRFAFLSGWSALAVFGRVWRALAGGVGFLCAQLCTIVHNGVSRPSHPTSPTADSLRARGGDVGGLGRGRMRSARMVPLPMGWVVRAGDEESGKCASFARISTIFSFWARCALRVTGAHQVGAKGL